MRVLFAGPSLYKATPNLTGIALRAPAAHGDLTRAVLEGAYAIGLVDGHFEATAAVWHKEILFALSQGVRVLGAASMGALRAAECAAFGMEPIGVVAERYISGMLDDDAAVAQVHAPAELSFAPLSETLVDAEATINVLLSAGLVTSPEASSLLQSAKSLFFKNRTVKRIITTAHGLASERVELILESYNAHHFSIKKQDALMLVEKLRLINTKTSDNLSSPWQFSQPAIWQRSLASIARK